MNRLERLTSILLMLQSRKKITAQQLATHFDTSIRTIYRDVRVLEEAGVPVGAEAGLGYYLMEGYSLPPVMFTKEEAAALLTGEKLIEKFGDDSVNKQFGSAMNKVRAVLRSSEKDFLETLNENIAVHRYGPRSSEDFPNHFISDIQMALVQRQVLSIEYYSHHSSEENKRMVEPIGLCHVSGHWHLIAYCRLRKDFRDFRLDRIKSLRTLSEQFEKRKHKSLQEYLNEARSDQSLLRIVLQIDHSLSKYASDMKYYLGLIEEKKKEDHIEMVFLYSSLEQFAQWILMWGNKVKIVEPEELNGVMKTICSELSIHYN